MTILEKPIKSDGGPSAFYDQPYKDWVTTNDQMEWLAEAKWGKYAIHLKDIFKGLCRWGDKEVATIEYDARKIIYYGVRVLKMIVGVDEMRKYLQTLLDDPQFKGIPEELFLEEPAKVPKVVYNFGDMAYDQTETELNCRFVWGCTPQGHNFWRDANKGRIPEEEYQPILDDMQKQYEEWVKENTDE